MTTDTQATDGIGRYRDAVTSLGLDPATVEQQATLLIEAVRQNEKPCFAVLDTCRLDNGGILPLPDLDTSAGAQGYAAFIPAAGAASRYTQPLFALLEALERGDDAGLERGLRQLQAEGAHDWPLPERLAKLLAAPDQVRHLTAAEAETLVRDLQLPKALMPCVQEGISFLAMKSYEHARLPGLEGQVFVTPPGQTQSFNEALQKGLKHAGRGEKAVETRFIEQGPALSTVRFLRNGKPFLEPDGSLSTVPAGHGALAQLFPEVKKLLPKSQALFIRNIDNVMGTHPGVIAASEAFLATHRTVLTAVQGIREALGKNDLARGAEIAVELMEKLPGRQIPPAAAARLAGLDGRGDRQLWELQFSLFHTNPLSSMSDERLLEVYRRPVTLLGQVPNTAKDVGGTPCLVAAGASQEKVCIEVPHVSPADKAAFLANPEKATHFNPVFCAVEITPEPDYYASRNRNFWLMSEKTYRGQPVMYFETVLYELIGNSELANCLFVEVPRSIFNPHKTLKDAAGRSARDWLAD